ncbi:MAG: cupredoxin domain-containing protein, partial [Candidatus Heimdallarchaeota archaeon]
MMGDEDSMMGDEDSMMGDEDSMMGGEDEDHEDVEDWEEPTGKVKEVSITAYYWRFEPSAILVSENDTVRLTISSVNNMMPMMARMFPNHGIAIEDYGLNYTLPVGETVTIEFVATKNGEVHFHCSIYCGVGHEEMHGELIVNGADSTHMEPSNGITVAGPMTGTLT